jgi:hypothetical protein
MLSCSICDWPADKQYPPIIVPERSAQYHQNHTRGRDVEERRAERCAFGLPCGAVPTGQWKRSAVAKGLCEPYRQVFTKEIHFYYIFIYL